MTEDIMICPQAPQTELAASENICILFGHLRLNYYKHINSAIFSLILRPVPGVCCPLFDVKVSDNWVINCISGKTKQFFSVMHRAHDEKHWSFYYQKMFDAISIAYEDRISDALCDDAAYSVQLPALIVRSGRRE